MKNPLTLAGIEPATFKFVAQHLNHCTTAEGMEVQLHIFVTSALDEGERTASRPSRFSL